MRRPSLAGSLAAAAARSCSPCSGGRRRAAVGRRRPPTRSWPTRAATPPSTIAGSGAFAQPVPGLDGEQRRDLRRGQQLLQRQLGHRAGLDRGRDGLGPLFNAQSCSSCHFRDGRAQPPADADDPERGLLIRLSVARRRRRARAPPRARRPAAGPRHPRRAGRGHACVITRDRADRASTPTAPRTRSLAPHLRGARAPTASPIDGLLVSPRIAPAVFGVGLLEAVPADDILALADPDDDGRRRHLGRAPTSCPTPTTPDGDRCSGASAGRPPSRASRSRTPAPSPATSASRRRCDPTSPAHALQAECLSAPERRRPELDDRKLDQVTFYTRTLAVPARRDVGAPDTQRRAGDSSRSSAARRCHVDELRTGASDIAALDQQTIRPYTDLLLHDMGPGLADGRPDGGVVGTRTRPTAGVAHAAAVGHRPRRDRERPHPLPPRRPRPQPRGGDPLARRRGRGRPRPLPSPSTPKTRAAAHRVPGEPVTRFRILAVAPLARRGRRRRGVLERRRAARRRAVGCRRHRGRARGARRRGDHPVLRGARGRARRPRPSDIDALCAEPSADGPRRGARRVARGDRRPGGAPARPAWARRWSDASPQPSASSARPAASTSCWPAPTPSTTPGSPAPGAAVKGISALEIALFGEGSDALADRRRSSPLRVPGVGDRSSPPTAERRGARRLDRRLPRRRSSPAWTATRSPASTPSSTR